MALAKDVLTDGLLAELDRFENLLRGLSDADRDAPSRCEGWTAGDVAAHLVGTMTDITAGRYDGLGTPEVTQREVEERRSLTPRKLADECAAARAGTAQLLPLFDDAAWASPAPGGFDGSLADAVEALWYDAFLHADDIRVATGRPTELGPGLAAAVSHVTQELRKRGWEGNPPAGEDDNAMAFVLVATGRAPAEAYPEPLLDIYAD